MVDYAGADAAAGTEGKNFMGLDPMTLMAIGGATSAGANLLKPTPRQPLPPAAIPEPTFPQAAPFQPQVPLALQQPTLSSESILRRLAGGLG